MLKCIVGKLKLDSGSVTVFGEPPGLGSSTGVPGSRVGYMPQEMALFGEFNISETLIYFARVFGMTNEKYKGKETFLNDVTQRRGRRWGLVILCNNFIRRRSDRGERGDQKRSNLCDVIYVNP